MASKVIYIAVAATGIAVASGAAWWLQKPKAPGNAAQASSAATGNGAEAGKPVAVEAAKVELARLSDDTQAVGSLRSRRGVVLRPEVSGRITQLNFTDGQRVRKGQVLVQFDDQLPLAQVQQSQAELSIARANQKRNQELVAQNFISQRSLDESAANLQVAEAKLSLAKATAARLKIVAPFDGIAGIRLVNVGDYLKDGADIVNIEDIEAIFVDFRLPERFQNKVRRGQTAKLDIDALPGRSYTAQIQAIDPLIDANGRSIGIRGCIDNRQLQLRPGMFARVNTVFGVRENARVIPEEAIVPQGGRQFVIKLLEGPKAQTWTTKRVEVKVGLRSPGKVEILEGLEAGDTVVATGQQRVQKDGTVVSMVEVARGNRPAAAENAAGPAAAPGAVAAAPASAPSAPVSGSQNVAAKAPQPALAGPNPCGVVVSEAAAMVVPVRSVSTPPRSPAPTAARDPA
ncbi:MULTISPECIES: efflux RND transporter periplasmic adaptor subunit [unclassified Polaromonas]|uniref:efflux RND transporter periplasmic adaptor subunit n=1 Tax=unclassified Polaromonas TaxID=2638319 RepID=UPI000F09519B|nr:MULTISPECIES: efflux RND transporter periplasmic adaptor subunit [unclassified Polaromonas]AYQ29326.1 efflux RND transporter periplasmic adaptor subunit [Polaromonas sp. SP1]QGJ19560.1 efflux RND transporter periplasmic adaptor subunit [Polaromonas sp. Pch-P]